MRTFLLSLSAFALTACATSVSPPEPSGDVAIPFDFSHNALLVTVNIHGQPVHMFLDTGVDPSVIELTRAEALGLHVDHASGGEASGEGDAAHATVYETTIDGLSASGHDFHSIAALGFDMSGLSAQYGSQVDGVLGYSFLSDKIVLVDYQAHVVHVLERTDSANALTSNCRQHWQTPLQGFGEDQIPMIAEFHIGDAAAPISLDTGSNGGITLYQNVLDLPGVRAALTPTGQSTYAGARGTGSTTTYTLNAPVGFGPFTLPTGQVVTLRDGNASPDTRVANIGNRFFSAITPKILFDYQARQMTFYAQCAAH